jgi:hypothetical protein
MIPMVLRIQIETEGKKGKKERNFWIPVFLLWAFLLWLFIIFWSWFMPLLLFVAVILALTGKAEVALNISLGVAECLSAITGTSVHIGSRDRRVHVEIL